MDRLTGVELNLFERSGQTRMHRLEVKAMWQRLYRVAYSWCHDPHLAADLVQDTIAKALDKQHQLQDRSALKAWLFAILVNGWRDHCRHAPETVDVDTVQFAHEADLEAGLELAQTIARVRTAIARLSAEHREVLTLVVLEGMAYDEVARALGIPIGTVTSRLCRARATLRKSLGEGAAGSPAAALRRVK